MPWSTHLYKEECFDHIKRVSGGSNDFKILDVGAGSGAWGKGLLELNVEALEVHEPFIHEYNIPAFYRYVYLGDIRYFNFDKYDYLILGDILEHLTKEDGVALINKINEKEKKCFVGVPYLLEQGEKGFDGEGKEYDAKSQKHEQPDLTPEIMKERYPSLKVFFSWEWYGYYKNY